MKEELKSYAEIGQYGNPRQEHLSRFLGEYTGSGENRYKCFQG